ncbi:MAG: hypothetical protein EZS26_002270 [Candidatus Ordinivivax streblomastigis]|uniref:HTH cro/C1-type domain-containing protein n=1 Tax=Candidatus Ordinivivax streblomastigis TaxID=2540710 RepID=A0A5M8NZG2_9BACT|nr:MAG: hypothetical protein EZS26_002270 [Candidatus Ordinivivax streblomastigis]
MKQDEISEQSTQDAIDDPRVIQIANKIKELRIQKGYSSHENFAWDNNLNRVQYWRIEKGKNITIKTLLTILDIHKISLEAFFSGMDELPMP